MLTWSRSWAIEIIPVWGSYISTPLRYFAPALATLKAGSLGMGDLGAISSPLREVEIVPRSPTPRDALAGRSHVYQRAKHAKGISLAPGIVPKGPSTGAHGARRRTGTKPPCAPLGAPKPTSKGFGRGVTRQFIGQTEWSHGPFRTHIHNTYAWAGPRWARQWLQHAKPLPELVANTPL